MTIYQIGDEVVEPTPAPVEPTPAPVPPFPHSGNRLMSQYPALRTCSAGVRIELSSNS